MVRQEGAPDAATILAPTWTEAYKLTTRDINL